MALTINTKIINDADNYTADAKQIKGGYGVVATVSDLSGLPAATIIEGSLYYAQDVDKFYKYNGSTWEVAEFGGGNVDDVLVNGSSIVSNKIANLTGSNLPSHSLSKISDVTATASELNKLSGVTTTTAQLNYLNTTTSDIQTLINGKLATLTSENAGDNVTIIEAGGHNLPSGYTELEYIESSGTQYISIPTFIPTNTSGFKVKCRKTSWTIGSRDEPILGSKQNDQRWWCGFDTNGIYIGFVTNLIRYSYTLGTDVVLENNYKNDRTKKINGTTIEQITETITTTLSPFTLFRYTNGGEHVLTSSRVYYLEITNNNNIIHNLIPARNSSNVLGMYDTVTDTFYTNAGTGTFTAGPVITTTTKINALSGLTATVTELNYVDGVTSSIQTQLNNKETADATILKQANVVDNVTSTSTIYPLSANQGKVLQTEINNLKNIGRFLAVLNCSNGTVSSQPSGEVGDTYSYKVGDYYRVGANGSYAPKGTAIYTIDSTSGSSNFEQGQTTYGIGDVIYCSNLTATTSTWVKQESSGGGKVLDVLVDGTTILSDGIANLTASNVPSIPLTKVSDVTATATEVNVLDGITATTTELNYVSGVTSSIQNLLNNKEETSNKVTTISSSSSDTEYPSAKLLYDSLPNVVRL